MNKTVSKNRHGKISQAVWLGLLLMAGVAGGIVWYWRAPVSADKPAAVTVPTERSSVHALGRLEPSGTILQLAPTAGNEGATIESLMVQEGDDVGADSVLAVFDNRSRREAMVKEAAARLEAARARLSQVQAGAKPGDIEAQEAVVALARRQSEVAARELARAKELFERKALNEELLETRQWEVDRLELEYKRASGMLKSLRDVRDIDVLVAQKDVLAADAALTVAQKELDSSSLKAPASGRVLRIHAHEGERITDKGLMELGDVTHMQAVAEVFEADVRLVSPGMRARVFLEGMSDPLVGSVSEIGHVVARKIVLTNDPVSDTDARVVEVRITLDPKSAQLVERLSNSRVEIFIDLKEVRVDATSRHTEPQKQAGL